MKYIIFEQSRNFIQALIAIFFGIIASSCAPQLDISAITAEAQNELLMMDKKPYNDTMKRHLQPEDITEGVIEDYVALIDFLVARNELRAKTLAPTVPLFTDTDTTFPRVVFFYRGRFEIERGPDRSEYVKEYCGHECTKILFEGYAESVLYVKIDPHSLEVVPSSIREFRKTDDCSQSYTRPPKFRKFPALGLCLEMQTPNNGLELLETDGLHVFEDSYHIISPLAPKEFWVDSSKPLPTSHHQMKAFRRSIQVKKDLKHVTAWSHNTQHRAIGIRSDSRPIEYFMLFDYTCVKIAPKLPVTIVNKLIEARAGENSLNPDYDEGDKFYYGEEGDEGPLCQGAETNEDGLFTHFRFDFPSVISSQEIVDRLNTTLRIAKAKGDTAVEWQALNKALHSIFYYPEFNSAIAPQINSIVLDAAKRDLSQSHLRRMPHKSMEPYLDDLIWIIESTLSELGCEGLECPKNTRSSKLSRLAEVLNGAGPNAAPYIYQIEQANKDMYEKFGPEAARIGGTQNAKLCIHNKPDCRRR